MSGVDYDLSAYEEERAEAYCRERRDTCSLCGQNDACHVVTSSEDLVFLLCDDCHAEAS